MVFPWMRSFAVRFGKDGLMKGAHYFTRDLSNVLLLQGVETHSVKGVRVVVVPDRNLLGYVTSLLVQYRLAEHSTQPVTLKLARAPSQVDFWRSLAAVLQPFDCPESKVFFFDEIEGNLYAKLWAERFVAEAAPGVLASIVSIDAGDGSREHAESEAARLSKVLQNWSTADTYTLAVGGTSPNPSEGPSECHLAFHREDIAGDISAPYMAIPMSPAASVQQAAESVVANSSEIQGKWVVSSTAYDLTQNTDDLVLCIPEQRGRNLWRMLHDDPKTLPAAQIQRHRRLLVSASEEWPSVVVVTVRSSWNEYQDEAKRNA